MQFLTMLGSVLLAAASVAASSSIDPPPNCGSKCIIVSTLASTCSPTNVTCICTNAALNAEIQSCVLSNCTIKEALQTEKYSYATCGVVGEDRTGLVWILGITFGVLGLVAFGLRCVARLYMGTQTWGMDDWAMCLAVAFMIPLCAISVPLARRGLGLDMWNVSFDDITTILYLYYFDEIFYISALSFTKVSMLFFYLKVFPKRSFRTAAYILIGLNVSYNLGYALVLIFQCNPINGAWLGWAGDYETKCVSINVLGWSAAAINIVLDLSTIILPLPELYQLSMSIKRKAQIMIMFTIGFFVTIVSAVRLRSLIQFGTTRNVTQDYVEVGYWSTIEVPVGIICACLPAIRSLFSQVFPSIFGTTRQGKSAYDYGSRGASKLSKMSGRAKLASNTGSTQTQIRVKQEWTVMSNPTDVNRSDVELVPYEKTVVTSHDDISLQKTTVPDPHDPWTSHGISAQRDSL